METDAANDSIRRSKFPPTPTPTTHHKRVKKGKFQAEGNSECLLFTILNQPRLESKVIEAVVNIFPRLNIALHCVDYAGG